MLERGFNCPPSSGTGRLFDAAAALLGVTDYNRYEAMSGMMLEAAASRSTDTAAPDGVMRIQTSGGGLCEIDHRPLLARLLEMDEAGAPVEDRARMFHVELADGFTRAAQAVAGREGVSTVALSGGVFCNTLFSQLVMDRLASAGLDVLTHRLVSPSDGGLAYGQAAVSAAVLADLGQE